jgi:hypothetical protein
MINVGFRQPGDHLFCPQKIPLENYYREFTIQFFFGFNQNTFHNGTSGMGNDDVIIQNMFPASQDDFLRHGLIQFHIHIHK